MIENTDQFRGYAGVLPQQLIGTQTIVVPYHVIKYCLREGGGAGVEPGMTIQCCVSVYLIDGSQIVRGNRTTKYLFGRKRLIRGLELGLKGVKKNQKLRLVISQDYAYADEVDIRLIPPHSKLIFEIDVVGFYRYPPEKMSDVELYYEVYHYLDLSDKCLRKREEVGGLGYISQAYRYACKIKNYRSNIVKKILLKWGNILFHREEYENALAVISQIEKYQLFLEDYFRLHIKILQALGKKVQLQKLIEKMYNQNLYNNNIKRICVNYYKQTQNWQKLKKLNGYNFKKDQFLEIKAHQPTNNNLFRYIY